MTGYGRGEVNSDGYTLITEIKTVNHRYLEVNVRIPRQLNALEDTARAQVQQAISRGKCDIYINFDDFSSQKAELKVDNELAIVYYNSLLALSEQCKLPKLVNIETVAAFPGVISQDKPEVDLDFFSKLLEKSLAEALAGLSVMRKIEGNRLTEAICQQLNYFISLIEQISVAAPLVIVEYRKKLAERIKDALDDVALDEGKLINEVAFFTDKADITEELTRLNSHSQLFLDTLKNNNSVGRKLDFILQEMNREINTIGSKANSSDIATVVIEAKSVLEKVREQTQNLE